MGSGELHYEGPKIEKDGHGIRPTTPRPTKSSIFPKFDVETRAPSTLPYKPLYVDSTGDDLTVNNALRHEYRVLTAPEKDLMRALKDKGAEFLALLELRPPSDELWIARTRLEEAVMWAVKDVTR